MIYCLMLLSFKAVCFAAVGNTIISTISEMLLLQKLKIFGMKFVTRKGGECYVRINDSDLSYAVTKYLVNYHLQYLEGRKCI